MSYPKPVLTINSTRLSAYFDIVISVLFISSLLKSVFKTQDSVANGGHPATPTFLVGNRLPYAARSLFRAAARFEILPLPETITGAKPKL